jgi:hypothetical protein
MTLIEVLCALVVLLLGVLGFAQAIAASARSTQAMRENLLATQAARRTLEELQANVFAEIFWRYNNTPDDDPGGPGTAQGGGFAVDGLAAVEGDADGLPGEVVFPVLPGAPGVLREDVVDASLGMPHDLDGVAGIDGADHSDDYRLLPVLVRVRWRGTAGTGSVELRTMLANY